MKILTICGSMRFYEQMLQVAADETLNGNIILAPFMVVKSEDQNSEVKRLLDQLHFAKIDMSSGIIVVTNQHGYVGHSTWREMGYALAAGKTMDVREFKLPEPTPETPHGFRQPRDLWRQ
jgi:hypothetical protein